MKKILSLSITALLMTLLVLLNVRKSDAAVGDTTITINKVEMTSYQDNYDRIDLILYNAENVTILNGSGVRLNSTQMNFKMCINGVDYTFGLSAASSSLGGYIASFGQIPTESTAWPVYLKHSAGADGTGNSSYYPSDYPGIPKGQETTLGFYKGQVMGKYVFGNDFTILINAAGTECHLVYKNHEVKATDCTVSGTYTYQEKTQASIDDVLTITPNKVAGKTVDKIIVKDADGNELTTDLTKQDNGTYTMSMPDSEVNITATYKDVTYTVDFGGNTLEYVPGTVMTSMPKGFWKIDNLPVSEESYFIWDENKTATLESYNAYFYADGVLIDTVSFDGTKSISTPAIPYKEGYKIVGWDTTSLPRHDVIINAIYQQIA